MRFKIKILSVIIFVFISCVNNNKQEKEYYAIARQNGILVNEGYNRCMSYVEDWLKETDPISGLIPQNLFAKKDVWNGHNFAADNYPFMVLTSYLLDDALYNGRMLDMLNTERKLTSRLGTLPAPYSFSKQVQQKMIGMENYILN